MDKEIKEKAKLELDEIFSKIEELERKKDQAKSVSRAKFDVKLAELNLKKAELQAKYDDLKTASEAKLDEMKEVFSKSADHFKQGLKELGTLID